MFFFFFKILFCGVICHLFVFFVMLWFCLSESFVLTSSCHVFVFLFVLFLLNFLVVFSSDDEGGWIQSQAGKSKSVMDCQHESFCLSFFVFVSRFLSGFCRLFDIFFCMCFAFPRLWIIFTAFCLHLPKQELFFFSSILVSPAYPVTLSRAETNDKANDEHAKWQINDNKMTTKWHNHCFRFSSVCRPKIFLSSSSLFLGAFMPWDDPRQEPEELQARES